jgi:hypothetical protein
VRHHLLIPALILVLSTAPAAACTFCDGFASRHPLRHYFAEARFVVYGKLKNPQPDTDGLGGTTELHVERVLKSVEGLANTSLVVIPRYIPIIGDTPNDYVLFCVVTNGKLDPIHGVPAGPAAATYLAQAAKLDRIDPITSLGFFFQHLDANDPVVAADAFLEFVRAADKDIQRAAGTFDCGKLRKWLADTTTPPERLSVYGMMLGLCGNRDDAAWLADELRQRPLPERLATNLGGLTAGLTHLDPDAGWSLIETVLTASDWPLTERVSILAALRYFQATQWAESKPRLLKCYTALLEAGDFADVAADDLRRWACWDLTPIILSQFGKPTHQTRIVRRAIVRYALACPDKEAKAFIATVRQSDPELVRRVEETNKLYESIPASSSKR